LRAAQIFKLEKIQKNTADDADMRGCAILIVDLFIRAYPRHPRLNCLWLRPAAALGNFAPLRDSLRFHPSRDMNR
jgi:hypothetical protein